MAATNTTEFLGLGQYVANDKPSFLGTYNSDMRTIDEFAEDTATRMGVVESQVTGATEDLSGVHASIDTLNTEVDTLIEKTANLPQDETQINNNTSAINGINQSIGNINDSIAEIINDIEYLDANAVKYGKIDTRYPAYSKIDVSGFDSNDYKLYIFDFKGNNKKSCYVPFAYAAEGFGGDPVNVEDTTFEFYNEARPIANNEVYAAFKMTRSGDTVTLETLGANNDYGYVDHKRYDLTLNGSVVEPTEYTSTERLTNIQFKYIIVNVPNIA